MPASRRRADVVPGVLMMIAYGGQEVVQALTPDLRGDRWSAAGCTSVNLRRSELIGALGPGCGAELRRILTLKIPISTFGAGRW